MRSPAFSSRGAVFAGCDWLCADGMTEAEYTEWIEPLCVYSALPSVLSLSELRQSLAVAGFTVSVCRDLAEVGNMEPNWRLFEEAGTTIPAPRSGTYELLWQHTVSTARAGHAGKFVVGTWSAVLGPCRGTVVRRPVRGRRSRAEVRAPDAPGAGLRVAAVGSGIAGLTTAFRLQ
ncbi:hypothetical protein [Streptomyces sanglieri]|uniref:hypothetical protein n=1 Tax=Streptomyces sanglieri TaxID=193460 RepID=UPI0035235A0F